MSQPRQLNQNSHYQDIGTENMVNKWVYCKRCITPTVHLYVTSMSVDFYIVNVPCPVSFSTFFCSHCTRLQITDATPVSSATLSYCTLCKRVFFSSHYSWLVVVLTCQNEAATWALRLDLRRIENKKPDMSVHTPDQMHRLFKIALSQDKLNIHAWSWACLRPFSHHMCEQCLFWCPF